MFFSNLPRSDNNDYVEICQVVIKLFCDKSILIVRFALLAKARLCRQVYHSDCSGIPLNAGINENRGILLFIDCGLVNSMLGPRWKDIRTMDERSLVNEGSLAEQFIGQHLVFLAGRGRNPELHYWLREELPILVEEWSS